MDRDDVTTPLSLISANKTWTERLLLVWDLFIVVLVSLNLALIAFDMLFSVDIIAAAFKAIVPAVHGWYARVIHAHFFAIDLGFVTIFLFDVLLGWGIAIAEKRYYRWYFYPFVHWYDVLGCIPVAGFRLLRVLRVISIIIRLQHLGIIDVRNWALYRNVMVYYDILVEEVSDRVVINVLSGVQREVSSGGNALTQRIVRDVVQPRQQQLVTAASAHIERALIQAWQDNRTEIRAYIATLVHGAVRGNRALGNLERVPMLGDYASRALDEAITDSVHDVLEQAVTGLESREFDDLVQHITDSVMAQLLDQGAEAPSELSDAALEVIDLIKEQVAVQQWRSHFEDDG